MFVEIVNCRFSKPEFVARGQTNEKQLEVLTLTMRAFILIYTYGK